MPPSSAAKKPAVRDAITALDNRVQQLQERDRVLLAEQIRLEGGKPAIVSATNIVPMKHSDQEVTVATRHVSSGVMGTLLPASKVIPTPIDAGAYLDHGKIERTPGQLPAERLADVIVERRAIAAALALAADRGFRLRLENEVELVGDIREAWNLNIRKAAAATRALLDLAAERQRLRDEHGVRSGGLPFDLPCGRQADRCIAFASLTSPIREFLEAAQRAALA